MKPSRVHSGDKVAIVSLSSGSIGEKFNSSKREGCEKMILEQFNVSITYMPSSLKGLVFLAKNPKYKALDLIEAFKDDTVKLVWFAIGGSDSFRVIPYLMTEEFKRLIKEHPKIFLGFSDATPIHFTLYKLGLLTYYGPTMMAYTTTHEFPDAFKYTSEWMTELFNPHPGKIISSSPVWTSTHLVCSADTVHEESQLHSEVHGIEFLRGSGTITGALLGGLLETFSDMILFDFLPDQKDVYQKNPVFPSPSEWSKKILFIEPCPECAEPARYREILQAIDSAAVFSNVVAVIHGKPYNETFYEEYKTILLEITGKYNLPCVYNLNFGHTHPQMILPYGQPLEINFEKKYLKLVEGLVS